MSGKRGLATQDVSDNAWGGRQSICSEGCKLTLWGSAGVPVGCVEIRDALVVSKRKMAKQRTTSHILPIILLCCTLGATVIQPAIASSGRSDSKKAGQKVVRIATF